MDRDTALYDLFGLVNDAGVLKSVDTDPELVRLKEKRERLLDAYERVSRLSIRNDRALREAITRGDVAFVTAAQLKAHELLDALIVGFSGIVSLNAGIEARRAEIDVEMG